MCRLLEVSVVIGGDENLIFRAIDSFKKNCIWSDDQYRINIVANPSTEETLTSISTQYPDVRIFRNTERMGFARNHNLVLRQISAKYVLIINDDILFQDGSIQALINYMENNPQVGVVGPKLLNLDGTLQPSTYSFPTLIRSFGSISGFRDWLDTKPGFLELISKFIDRAPGKSRLWDHNSTCEVDTLKGACLLIRMEALKKVGLMDEVSLMYVEETEWLYRFKENGLKVVFLPLAEIVHYGRVSSTKMGKMFIRIEETKGLLNYFEKHGSGLTYFLFRVGSFLLFVWFYLVARLNRNEEMVDPILSVLTCLVNPNLLLSSEKRYLGVMVDNS